MLEEKFQPKESEKNVGTIDNILSFKAYVDDKPITSWFAYVEGNNLFARVLPREQWPKELKDLEEPVRLYFFEMPYSRDLGPKGLERYIDSFEGQSVSMGDVPSLRTFRQTEVRAELKPGHLYDLFSIGDYRGKRVMGGGGRFSTQRGEVPQGFTFDELKLLAIENLGLTLEEAQSIDVVIKPMTAWGDHGRAIIAGFELKGTDRNRYGVMVTHLGDVVFYNGRTKEQVRAGLGF